jgi:hypothetical protein
MIEQLIGFRGERKPQHQIDCMPGGHACKRGRRKPAHGRVGAGVEECLRERLDGRLAQLTERMACRVAGPAITKSRDHISAVRDGAEHAGGTQGCRPHAGVGVMEQGRKLAGAVGHCRSGKCALDAHFN